jgi:hypothetical protein
MLVFAIYQHTNLFNPHRDGVKRWSDKVLRRIKLSICKHLDRNAIWIRINPCSSLLRNSGEPSNTAIPSTSVNEGAEKKYNEMSHSHHHMSPANYSLTVIQARQHLMQN